MNICQKRWSIAPKHTFWNAVRINQTGRIHRINHILAKKFLPDPPFHTRQGQDGVELSSKVHQ